MTALGGRRQAAAGTMRYALDRRPFGTLTPEQAARLKVFRLRHPDVSVHCVDGVWRAEDASSVTAGPRFDDLMEKLGAEPPPSLPELLRLARSILPPLDPDSG